MEIETITILDTTGIDGVITIGGGNNLADLLEEKGVPQVSFAGYGHYMVALKDTQFLHESVSALVKAGCRRIGSWGTTTYEPSESDQPGSEQIHISAFHAALAEFDLPLHLELVYFTSVKSGEWNRFGVSPKALGYERALELWSGPEEGRPDGLVISDDLMTSGVLSAFAKLRLDPVKTVQIATHANANSSILYPFDQDLIRIEYDTNNLVDSLFDLLDRVLRGETIVEKTVYIDPVVHLPALKD